mmetsp:Transcript_22151/g.60535  ORF Transcript_22151/g.60535 Transcript_22151/m.60535 type:complete len:254 (-) Transcript_22151:43-804(-)
MREAALRGDADLAAECRHVRHAPQELLDQDLLLDVEDRGREDGAVLVDLLHLHAVLEGLDAQLSQQHRGARGDLGANVQDLEVGDQLDLPLDDLGTDVQGLEEGGLRRVHAGGAGRQRDVNHRRLPGLGGGRHAVLRDDVPDVVEGAVGGEDEAHVAVDAGAELVQARLRVLLVPHGQPLPDHGVLAHEHDGLAAELDTDVLHLLGGHVVDADEQCLRVIDAEVDELVEVGLLLGELLGVRHLGRRVLLEADL